MRAYQKVLPEIRTLGASLLAISPMTPDHSLTASEKWGLEFEVLSDVGNAAARRFGLIFRIEGAVRQVYETMDLPLPRFNADDSWELPVPGTFVIGKDGTIRFAFVDPNYTARCEPQAILEALRSC